MAETVGKDYIGGKGAAADLQAFLAGRGLMTEAETLARLEAYADLTLAWNEKINVTAIRDKEDFLRLNVLDSLTLAGFAPLEDAARVLDMGTGGGLPGMPLAILYPDKAFTLTDAVGKKLKVVSDVAATLGLSNVSVVHARAEELAREEAHRERYDLVVSRAVASLPVLAEYCLPFVRVGGVFCAYKTESAAGEIDAASRAIRTLGGKLENVENSGFGDSGHLFVFIRKERPTPHRYPRRAGQPSKDPL